MFHIVRVMLVGWGGNNGSTLTGGVIANRELVSPYSSLFCYFIYYFVVIILAPAPLIIKVS